jgi:Superinfection immunity protein
MKEVPSMWTWMKRLAGVALALLVLMGLVIWQGKQPAAVNALLLLVVYGLPGIIAEVRAHHQRMAIIGMNILLGWTILGWVIALIWAVSATPPPPPRRTGEATP